MFVLHTTEAIHIFPSFRQRPEIDLLSALVQKSDYLFGIRWYLTCL